MPKVNTLMRMKKLTEMGIPDHPEEASYAEFARSEIERNFTWRLLQYMPDKRYQYRDYVSAQLGRKVVLLHWTWLLNDTETVAALYEFAKGELDEEELTDEFTSNLDMGRYCGDEIDFLRDQAKAMFKKNMTAEEKMGCMDVVLFRHGVYLPEERLDMEAELKRVSVCLRPFVPRSHTACSARRTRSLLCTRGLGGVDTPTFSTTRTGTGRRRRVMSTSRP